MYEYLFHEKSDMLASMGQYGCPRQQSLLYPDFVVKGRDALKAHFRNYLKTLGHLEVKSINKFKEAEDSIFFEASVVSDLGPAEVYDALVLKQGKISYHFTGVK